MFGTDMKLAGIEKHKAILKIEKDSRKKRRKIERLIVKFTGMLF